jgi:hypothetical protein
VRRREGKRRGKKKKTFYPRARVTRLCSMDSLACGCYVTRHTSSQISTSCRHFPLSGWLSTIAIGTNIIVTLQLAKDRGYCARICQVRFISPGRPRVKVVWYLAYCRKISSSHELWGIRISSLSGYCTFLYVTWDEVRA